MFTGTIHAEFRGIYFKNAIKTKLAAMVLAVIKI